MRTIDSGAETCRRRATTKRQPARRGAGNVELEATRIMLNSGNAPGNALWWPGLDGEIAVTECAVEVVVDRRMETRGTAVSRRCKIMRRPPSSRGANHEHRIGMSGRQQLTP